MCQTSERTLIRKCKIFLKENAPPCILCEDSIPDHLEFDHVDRILKTKAISSIRTVEELIAEIPKVRVLCKKCHRKITYLGNNYNTVNPVFIQFGTLEERRKIYEIPGVKRNRDFINNLKLELKGCQNPLCNDIFDPENLPFYEWDHVDCRTKKYQISVMVSTSKSIDSIKQELEKCQLLCGYCHSIKTRQDQKLMKEYYQSLTEPLIKKEKRKSRGRILTQENIIDIRMLYNEGDLYQEEIANIFDVCKEIIQNIISNKSHIDPNYKRTRIYRMSKEEYAIRNEQMKYDREIMGMSNKEIEEKYDLTRGGVTKAIGIRTTTLDEKEERNKNIIKDFLNGTSREDLEVKYKLKKSIIGKIITDNVCPRKQIENRNRNILIDFHINKLSRKDLSAKYNVTSEVINKTLRHKRLEDFNIDPTSFLESPKLEILTPPKLEILTPPKLEILTPPKLEIVRPVVNAKLEVIK